MSGKLPNILFIHGLGGNLKAAWPIARAIGDDVAWWSFDLLGHGARPVPSEISTAAIGEDLMKGLDELGIEQPYLFGKSYGGRVALYLASRYPDRFRGVCLLGTTFETKHGIGRAQYLFDPDRPRKTPLSEKQEKLFRLLHGWMLRAAERAPEVTEEVVRSVTLPVLVLCGRDDPIAPAADGEYLYSLLPNARLVLFDGTAHPPEAIPLEAIPEPFLAFIREVEAREGRMRLPCSD